MNTKQKHTGLASQRSGERGAALLTTLLVSTLLLAAGSALIVSTSISTTTEIDATAEMQAYAAAEAGLESALNVLRGNVAPDASLTGTKISFLTAVTPATSNKAGDNSTLPRLSGWLPYSSGYSDRVAITSNYAPQNGFAYRISVRDPDNKPAGKSPSTLVISSTGYGPKGASKVLEMVVTASTFDFSAPATITVRGADSGTAMRPCSDPQGQPCFGLGNSSKKVYSGVDNANPSAPVLPAFAVTNADTGAASTSIGGGPVATLPKLGVLPIDTLMNPGATGANSPPSPAVSPAPPNVAKVPAFLQSPDTARALLNALQATAVSTNRYFTSWNGASGTTSAPVFTFIDGNATITGGAGLVVCTGNLLLHENSGFNGLILVLGNGKVSRQGGGPSTFLGAIVVASFDRTSGPFLRSEYNTQPDQGNVVTMQYDSDAVQSALSLSGLRVLHVVEK
jgi:hypothetical protein